MKSSAKFLVFFIALSQTTQIAQACGDFFAQNCRCYAQNITTKKVFKGRRVGKRQPGADARARRSAIQACLAGSCIAPGRGFGVCSKIVRCENL